MNYITQYDDDSGGYLVISSDTPKHPTTLLMDNIFRELSADSISLNRGGRTHSLVVKYTPLDYPDNYVTITSYETLTDLQVVLHKTTGEIIASESCGMSIPHIHHTVSSLIKQATLEDNI